MTSSDPTSSFKPLTLRDKLRMQYEAQVGDDGALDLFNPSVEAIIAPFYESVRPFAAPLSEADPFFDRFGDYFARGPSITSASTSTAIADRIEGTNVPLALRNDCKNHLVTWSIPRPCLRVEGRRGTYKHELRQLFVGDIVWLFFHERMGIHRMLGAILDDFVTRGRFPLRPAGVEGLVLEAMVREVKAGLSSTVRERDTSYRRCLGWTSDAGKGLENASTPKNASFNKLFHLFLQLVLGYYDQKRIAVAIQATSSAGKPSVATLTSIKETLGQLRKSFDPFKYGRNHTHTLSGIVWTFAALELVLRLRSQLGIPEPYQRADELIPAAHDLLIPDAKPLMGNRFTAHRDCAEAGRAILLDVQALDFDSTPPGSQPLTDADLEQWLTDVEGTFELYRSAYRVLTGIDFGTTAPHENPAVEQAA